MDVRQVHSKEEVEDDEHPGRPSMSRTDFHGGMISREVLAKLREQIRKNGSLEKKVIGSFSEAMLLLTTLFL